MNWTELPGIVRMADSESFKQLKCPDCGGRLKVEYVVTKQRGALYIECLNCKQIVRSSAADATPRWALDLGFVAETGGVVELGC